MPETTALAAGLAGLDRQGRNRLACGDDDMAGHPQHSERERPAGLTALLRRALWLDLEVAQQSGEILKVGAVLGDRTLARSGTGVAVPAEAELARLAGDADCVLGHNLARHDLPCLAQRVPAHPVLRLPVVDTLVLSPLAFPENPYHRLVKDYKLARESVNDPVADARQAAVLFEDEFHEFAGLCQTQPELFALLRFLLVTPAGAEDRLAQGMALFFDAVAGAPSDCMAVSDALLRVREFVARFGCGDAPMDESLFQSTASRHALAYTLAWLRVAGANSVLPLWVRLGHPLTGELIRRWRDVPCAAPGCAYCRQTHDASTQLRRFFPDFTDFQAKPVNAMGGSLQRDIVEAGMREESLLAILPTAGGKSLCFQLPALARNYRRGVLTVVISPLQSLMKDQVDGLVRRTGTPFAAALYGLLTPPERGDVLRRVKMGDVALLYVSPEQLRNKTFREAIAQREIGCWVFDEAHCLSKWGHDFRPDYLYAGRFIREFSAKHGGVVSPIACFTATAKEDVKAEILKFFADETGRTLQFFGGGVHRKNLRFEVQMITSRTKLERIHDLLSERLPTGAAGTGIVFRATRADTVATTEFLQAKGWTAAHFHAGLTPSEKKEIQDRFLAGETRVICATNAFGMGIDKPDVRLVIHGDTPGSLENYLQEAGRAGRDGGLAECVLLYDEEDCERQFRLGAISELSRRDIAQILRGLRGAARGDKQELVITTGEILREEDIETGIAPEERGAETKVRTAIAWLERAGFIQRDENVTTVFQARPLVQTLAEAEQKLAPLHLPAATRELWLAILREVMNASPGDSLTVDRLALLPELASVARRNGGAATPEFVSGQVLKALGSMADARLLKRDTLMSAYVRHKVADHSRLRLERVLAVDRKMVDLLALETPDPEGWLPLNLRELNQRLNEELGTAAGTACSVEMVRALLRSLSEDGRGFAAMSGSIDLRHCSHDTYQVKVRRRWQELGELAEKRRRMAAVILDAVMAKVPAEVPARADLLVEFCFEDLELALEHDLALRFDIKPQNRHAAIERGLMFLHEQRVLVLQQGLAVFRSAMRIRFTPEGRREKYKQSDYEPLAHHYQERILQVHVMSEYAQLGLEKMTNALALVGAYFSLGKAEFIRRYLATKPELLKHATTAQSFQRIVTDLGNPEQSKIVTAPVGRNLLVLAGPGSGKTRVVVHRCAYLLRVERVRPQSVLVCCFNRAAALELRRRLADLVGAEARGVTVLTYHALAMRLLGRSFLPTASRNGTQASQASATPDFDALITDAVRMLRGETVPAGVEADEVRERLLAGFQHILVDEYQDIDAPQYELISAIAGRTLDDADQKLSILAVGDDDQNIYTFRGANVEFIRRFAADYSAEAHYLVENYRSTRHIIEAANQLVSANRDRMKTSHPIRIDRHRELLPAGGEFMARDEQTRGRVQIIRVRDADGQAAAVLAELRRLGGIGVNDWSRIAVLGREWEDLAQVRALAEEEGIPVRWWPARNAMPPLHQVREIHCFLAELAACRATLTRAEDLLRRVGEKFPAAATGNPWLVFLRRALEAWRDESANAELPAQEALEFLYETCAESRREFSYGEGVTLCTVHGAKGTEHDHVLLVGAWAAQGTPAAQEEQRRALYVGMTRARRSLAVFERADAGRTLSEALNGPAIQRSEAASGDAPRRASRSYAVLGLEDVHLGYAGCFGEQHPVQRALAELQPGSALTLAALAGGGLGLSAQNGVCVARFSRKAQTEWAGKLAAVRTARVLAMVRRRADQDDDAERRARYAIQEWEVPLVELVCEPNPDHALP